MAFSFAAPRSNAIAIAGLALLALLIPAAACAQDAAPTPASPQSASPPTAPSGQKGGSRMRGDSSATPASPAIAEQHRLPPDSTTKHTLALPGRSLAFTATAGSIRLFDNKGEPQADLAYTSYQLDGADARSRPVTFLFNGGPGAASAWLQFGDAGPWRLSFSGDAASPSASPELMPNAETWLDFTDLVFIDPVGTGYSRFVATGDEVRKRFFSVDGDVNALSAMIRRWLVKHDRLLSPKFVAGESYGGIRGPKIVNNLQLQQGVGIKALILVSPVLDFREFSGSSLLQYVWSLPTMAAVAREKEKGSVSRADLADVEQYARTDFLIDLLKGEADGEATNRIADKIAALTGIDQAVSRRLAGRFDGIEFRREFDRKNGMVAGPLRRLGDGVRLVPGFQLLPFRRSLRGAAVRAADERRGRPHHAQAELAAGRSVQPGQPHGREKLGLGQGAQSARFDRRAAADSRPRPKNEIAGGARVVRPRDAVFRLEDPARSTAGLCHP
jgi:carboxypeptidase C (cathepsin A)